jgi:serine/threonine protein kinase
MLDEDPKLIDFGLGKNLKLYKEVCDKKRNHKPLTQMDQIIFTYGSNPICGTHMFAPPEAHTQETFSCFEEGRIPERETRGTSYDVFSMGVLLWCLAEKSLPPSLSKREWETPFDELLGGRQIISNKQHRSMLSMVLKKTSWAFNPLILTACHALNPIPEERPQDAIALKEIWMNALENPAKVSFSFLHFGQLGANQNTTKPIGAAQEI